MGEDELSMDNILSQDAIDNLFVENVYPEETEGESSLPEENNEENNENIINTTESLFNSESVGSEENIQEESEDTDFQDEDTSPNNFYSSIAKALKEEGVFPDLEDDIYNNIKDPQDFRDLIEYQIQQGLDERNRRIDAALNVGVEPEAIQKYENTLKYIDSISDAQLQDESAQGESLRKNLIYQDFVNRGYSQDRALREVRKSFDSGSDIEDAKEALLSNRDYYQYNYNNLIQEKKKEAAEFEEYKNLMATELKESILDSDYAYEDLNIDGRTRRRIYDNISKPVYRDPETGEYLTELQKYEKDNKVDFMKNVGLLYTITNGFKNIDGLVKGKVKKEVTKGLRDLERKLNNTSRTSDGDLKYVTSLSDDPYSFSSKEWDLDV